jgi:hypothetical protein
LFFFWLLSPVDINRFERDKAEALSHQKEAMNRAFRVQLAKLLKEKEELQRKCQTLQSKEPNGKITGNGLANAAAASSQAAAAEMLKLIHENSILRIDKKKQEEQLQVKATIKYTTDLGPYCISSRMFLVCVGRRKNLETGLLSPSFLMVNPKMLIYIFLFVSVITRPADEGK